MGIRKLVINTSFGRFSISQQAKQLTTSLANRMNCWDIPRDDKDLILAVEILGEQANGEYATLKILEIPDDMEWEMIGFRGNEYVVDKDDAQRRWH